MTGLRALLLRTLRLVDDDLMAWVGSGAGRMPSARANVTPASKVRRWWTARASMTPCSLRWLTSGRHAVVAQAARVDRVGHEVVAERVHLDERRHLCRVAEVVGVDARA